MATIGVTENVALKPAPPPLKEDMSLWDRKLWQEQWLDYAILQSLVKKSPEYQAAVFRRCLGQKGREILQGRPFEQEKL